MKSESDAEVGAKFRARRRDLDMTQQQVADAASLSLPTLRKLEAGGHVTKTTRRAVAVALDWPSDAYDRLRLGADPGCLDEAELEMMNAEDGLSHIEVTLQRMGLDPIEIEIAIAAVSALVRRHR